MAMPRPSDTKAPDTEGGTSVTASPSDADYVTNFGKKKNLAENFFWEMKKMGRKKKLGNFFGGNLGPFVKPQHYNRNLQQCWTLNIHYS